MSSPAFLTHTPLPLRTTSTSIPVSSSRRLCAVASAPRRWKMGVTAPAAFKHSLLEKLATLDKGRAVANDESKQREIEQLIIQVEATNKSQKPGADPNLTAAWELIYTTSTSILGFDRPPFLQPSRIVQEIDAKKLTARNLEYYRFGPLEVLANSVEAKLKPVSDKRFDVNFIRFQILGIIPIDVEKNDRFRGWLEVTYLDKNLRISRGNRGSLFVLKK